MSWGSYSYGSAPFAGGIATQAAASGLQLWIGRAEYSGLLYLADGLSVVDALDTRRTCSFTLLDKENLIDRSEVAIGAEVRVTVDGTTVVFAGTIDELEENILGDTSTYVTYDCSCVDWSQLADRHIVAKKYETTGQTLRDVVQAIVNTDSGDSGETLADDGVTATSATVQEGPVLETVTFNYRTVTQCFDDLADLTGYAWYIDYGDAHASKRLHFFDIQTYYAPHDLDDATWSEYRDLRVRRTREKYRNVQYLRAGTTLSATRSEEFVGDGKRRTFNLSMDCGVKPTIKIDTVPVDAQYVDVRTDEEDQTGIKWFYEIGSDRITQSQDESVLTSGNTLAVTYRGQYPIILQGRADDEVSTRVGIEGGTGIYVDVQNDSDIDDEDMARERVSGWLRKYARIPDVASFRTDVTGFRAGQIMHANIPRLGLVTDLLIERVRFGWLGSDSDGNPIWRYDVQAISGEGQGGWADFYRRLADKGRPLTIRENEKLALLRSRRHGLIVGDVVSLSTALQDWDDDASRYCVMGMAWIGSQRVDDVTQNDQVLDGYPYGPMIGLPYS